MRKVVWIDGTGTKRLSMIRDNDPDSMAEYGVSLDPPDLGLLEWPVIETSLTRAGLPYDPLEIKKALYEALLTRELSSWSDVMRQQTGITAAVRAAAVKLYSRPEHQKRFRDIMTSKVSRLYRSLS